MILDNLAQWPRYAALGSRFAAGFEYLSTLTADRPLGRHELDGTNLFVLVQAYQTRPWEQCRFEAHRQYADIQLILAGRERIGWAPLASLPSVTEPYQADKDIAFYTSPDQPLSLPLSAGQWAVFFPEDGHAPGAAWEASPLSTVRKAVVKVRLG